ncbi:DUF4031 domain-containing protein [Mesorhizobium sp. M4A.F.Ca.ET.020.02.1.1]|uniref:DUF4031 domain-containing protein n=1 Tax=Mesorhizobium sp. M4A.F.Ca.ET.020.02.1.1 TaxID=2496652 RepID=UPI000FD44279|nr:DUF4031 domain-containing protein [Mesorhizobium sp. M4A.F.Ca.ET.020.02.1.1]RVD44637.1 DUF4031 domain-containing protein [Mesorhizobium sp. M4A.F.Ca.ET.020.02.1.1]
MAVYVDDMQAPFGNMIMCHMWADSDDELLAMVDKIGVQRKWIQGHPTLSFGKHKRASWVHFDIAQSKRAQAVKHGAIETDRVGPMEHTAKLMIAKGKEIGNADLVAWGEKKLAMVSDYRASRNG